MKLLLLLLIPFASFAQTEPTGVKEDTAFLNESVLFVAAGSDTVETVLDTIPVLMLVCDTVDYIHFPRQSINENSFDKRGLVNWVTGFEARKLLHRPSYETLSIWGDVATGSGYITQTFPSVYLDSNKQPLKKSIVIWLSKEL